MDIDRCAASNVASWKRRADELCIADLAITAFRNRCSEARLGINVSASKLHHFHSCGKVVSTFEFRLAQEGTAAANNTYTNKYGHGRMLFENAVSALKTTLYATLDLPGAIGDDRYGPFRLVADPIADAPVPIVMPHNSAIAYVGGSAFREDQACTDAATWERRGEVATSRRGERASGTSAEMWPAILASEDTDGEFAPDLVEVVLRDGARPLESVNTIRISKSHYEHLMSKVGRVVIPSGPSPDEEDRAFSHILKLIEEGTLRLEIVE